MLNQVKVGGGEEDFHGLPVRIATMLDAINGDGYSGLMPIEVDNEFYRIEIVGNGHLSPRRNYTSSTFGIFCPDVS